MTVPKVATSGNAQKPEQAKQAKPASPKQSQVRQDVVQAEAARSNAARAERVDRVEISTAARALANVASSDKATLQLSSQDLQALSGTQSDI